MPTFHAVTLLSELQQDVNNLRAAAERYLASQPHDLLLQPPAPGKWSAIQCLEHLNGYGRFYLPAFDEAFRKFLSQKRPVPEQFRSGWLGNYFTQTMLPKDDGSLKMKMSAPKNHNPTPRLDAAQTLDEFQAQQEWMLSLLQAAKKIDIGGIRLPTTLSKLVALKAGDTFRFLIAHAQRHMLQAIRSVEKARGADVAAVNLQYLSETAR
ncbi:DinB family protein [Chitinophaga sp. NPDC101104]|uniref:DinB family protein n=1 Tax=Chitinophaga sp. NPDC101104 TaxID=3390561 RepID=UPI003D009735